MRKTVLFRMVCFCLLLLLGLCISRSSIRTKPRAPIQASPSSPFATHNYKILLLDTSSGTYSGFRHDLLQLTRYGFDVTYDNLGTYLANPDLTTYDLSNYDAVVLQSAFTTAFHPIRMSEAEVEHFTTDYDGVLIAIGGSMMRNESSGQLWGWSSSPMQNIEERLGIDFTGVVPCDAERLYTRNGTLTYNGTLISDMPLSLTYNCPKNPYFNHYRGNVVNASWLYKFTWDTTDEIGITYYENATGAIGVFVNVQWVFAAQVGAGVEVEYYWWGAGNNYTQRDEGIGTTSEIIARILAHAWNVDFDTIIRPQPLAHFRFDDIGDTGIPINPPGWTMDNFDERAVACLTYFNQTLMELGANCASIAGLYGSTQKLWGPAYWQNTRAFMLDMQEANLWEFANHYDHWDGGSFYNWTTDQHKYYLNLTEGNMTQWGFEHPSIQYNPNGNWSPDQWQALQDLGYYTVTLLDEFYDDINPSWKNFATITRIKQPEGIIVHPSENLEGRGVENFTEYSKKNIWFAYQASSEDTTFQAWVGSINDVFVYVDHYECWRTGEVGPWRFKTVFWNVTYEIPDIRFVGFREGVGYFAKQNATLDNPTQSGSVIEFDLNASNVETVNTIGKGMVWYVINTTRNSKIQSVEIDGSSWYFFDDYTVRLPATNSHVKITLGTHDPLIPLISRSDASITSSSYDGYKLSFAAISRNLTNSRTEVYCGDRGEPVTIYSANGTLTWSYNASTKTLELSVMHYGPVEIIVDWRKPGDVNGDGVVDILDVAKICAHWYPGPPIGPLGYDPIADINYDGAVNILDLAIVSAYWTGPPKGPLDP